VEECSDIEYYTFLPVIIEAINANDFSIIKEVLEYSRSRFNWGTLQNSFRGLIHIHKLDFKDKPVAAKIVAFYILPTSGGPHMLNKDVLARSSNEWMNQSPTNGAEITSAKLPDGSSI
jgi:hypothetical protein